MPLAAAPPLYPRLTKVWAGMETEPEHDMNALALPAVHERAVLLKPAMGDEDVRTVKFAPANVE